MNTRMLILTAGYGEGHNAAARALAAATEERFGPGSARVVDIFALARPRLSVYSRRAYLSLINRAPRLWSSAYAWLDRSAQAPRLAAMLRRETALLGEIIQSERPQVLCSTYPIYAYLCERLLRSGMSLPPNFNVVTDSISINSLWWRAGCAGWFVPNADSAAVLRQAGVNPALLHITGFPVDPVFADDQRVLQPVPLGPGTVPRILYIINSGTRGARETARRLLAQGDWDVTCAVGRDEVLRTELMGLAQERPRSTPILGWTREIPRLLLTHHVVISKAGGATTQESIAARCPMIVNQIVPGQEEGNFELLRRHGIGAYASSPEAVLAELRRAFADNGRVWREWRASVDRLSRPNAAREIVATLFPGLSPRTVAQERQPAAV